MNTGKVIIGVAAGLAAGALLGLLFAPEKGVRTRRRILREAEKITDDMSDKFMDFLDNISEKFNEVKKDVTDFAEKAKSTEKTVENDLKAEKV